MAKEFKGIAYGEGLDGQLIDLYVPDGDGPRPLVIWSRGSGWLADTGRDDADVVAPRLNPRGFAVAGLAIRSSAQTRFPGQLRDIEDRGAAVRSEVGHRGRLLPAAPVGAAYPAVARNCVAASSA